MPSFTLTDLSRDLWTDGFKLTPGDLGLTSPHDWSVTKRTLRGGRREGVDLLHLDNGSLSVAIVPTRGMGLWKGFCQGDALGWASPVLDGPVNPAFIHPTDRGGLGWLDGFDEFCVRCGLESNGAPFEVAVPGPDGSTSRHVLTGLHGRIANIPAHFVAVHVDEDPPHAITIEGRVAESTIFHTQIEMTTRITTVPGSNRLVVRDEFTNMAESPGSMQLLYHWNFGPPFLAEGSTFSAPVETLVPRDAPAANAIGHWGTYGPPRPGSAEEVYLIQLRGDGPDGRTLAMLRAPEVDKAVVLRFRKSQLPCFTLWKNTRGLAEGYVTGLEPATNFPNPRPFEEARGRVIPLAPGGPFVAETELEVLNTRGAIDAIQAEIDALQAQGAPTIHKTPVEPFAQEG
ncbi:aldose 1-epimerase family protein [Tundrisphaera lichenicola]|uniref:aldose 1-epimerase family protein n=1 Tax=Tundrisphaera lichenicola TaxID=2029860 RepID=UPI003EB6CE5E